MGLIYLKPETLFVDRIDSNSPKGFQIKYVIVPIAELYRKEFKDFFASCMVAMKPGGKLMVLTEDCRLLDIEVFLPHILNIENTDNGKWGVTN